MRSLILFFLALFMLSCDQERQANTNPPKVNSTPNSNVNKPASKLPTYSYDIINTYEHDPDAFTQGLVIHEGALYESTGIRGKSSLRKVELTTGKVLQKFDLSNRFFGEGMTILNGKIYQITWQENTAFVYDINDFKLLKEFKYSGEGWGLTNDGKQLFMSDGTHVIRVVNPETFETERTIVVMKENGEPLMQLNELEYVKGEIWANVWYEPRIARIDPANGKLLGWIDLTKITDEQTKRNADNVLNGIAYDAAGDKLYITGKKWNKLYEIKVKEN